MSRDPFEQKIFDMLEVAFWGQDLTDVSKAAGIATAAVMEAIRFALINRDEQIRRHQRTLGMVLIALEEGGLVKDVRP